MHGNILPTKDRHEVRDSTTNSGKPHNLIDIISRRNININILIIIPEVFIHPVA